MPMTLTGTVTLNACGCTIATEYTSPKKGREAMHLAQRRIKALLQDIDAHHDCALVTPDNPNGDRRWRPKLPGIVAGPNAFDHLAQANAEADAVMADMADVMQTHDPES